MIKKSANSPQSVDDDAGASATTVDGIVGDSVAGTSSKLPLPSKSYAMSSSSEGKDDSLFTLLRVNSSRKKGWLDSDDKESL